MNKISIIMPVYNSLEFLKETIDSVKLQTYKNWELIIVDDNSTDGSRKYLIKKYRSEKKIKIFFNKKNYGPGYSRNKAIEKSSGNFLAFLDSDDLWVKTKLLDQMHFLRKNNLNLCHTNIIYKKKNNFYKRIYKIPKILGYQDLLYNNYITTSSVMIRKVKNFNYKFNNCGYDDYVFWLKILKKKNKFFLFKKYLTIYKFRKNSVSSNKFKSLKWIFNIYYNICDISLLKSLIYCFINICINFYKKSVYIKKNFISP